MKQVEVTILGQGYVLGCPEGGEDLLARAVADVDREMTAIRDAGRVKARERIAVLAALNIAYQLADRRASNEAGAGATHQAASADADADASLPVDLQVLVARIDAALDSDGHLL